MKENLELFLSNICTEKQKRKAVGHTTIFLLFEKTVVRNRNFGLSVKKWKE